MRKLYPMYIICNGILKVWPTHDFRLNFLRFGNSWLEALLYPYRLIRHRVLSTSKLLVKGNRNDFSLTSVTKTTVPSVCSLIFRTRFRAIIMSVRTQTLYHGRKHTHPSDSSVVSRSYTLSSSQSWVFVRLNWPQLVDQLN